MPNTISRDVDSQSRVFISKLAQQMDNIMNMENFKFKRKSSEIENGKEDPGFLERIKNINQKHSLEEEIKNKRIKDQRSLFRLDLLALAVEVQRPLNSDIERKLAQLKLEEAQLKLEEEEIMEKYREMKANREIIYTRLNNTKIEFKTNLEPYKRFQRKFQKRNGDAKNVKI